VFTKEIIKKYPEFYQKVWKVVAQIPKGEVRSYSWVAKKVGSAKAARAVGQALKNNPFPVIIPCHRVIRKDGSLGGYSQGLKKKTLLLKIEKRFKKR
ncbi:MAG TPA: cysteine methyltransferase, partial [Elusimicrobia bacterium]|nr:cysteine methyltransferase [Elusimicrobiota bacterium]